jgi:hypothetical protein
MKIEKIHVTVAQKNDEVTDSMDKVLHRVTIELVMLAADPQQAGELVLAKLREIKD